MLSLILTLLILTPLSFNMNLFIIIYYNFLMFIYYMNFFSFNEYFSFISLSFGLDKYSYCLIILTFWLLNLMMYSSLNLKKLYFSYLKVLIILMFFFLIMCFISLNYFMFYIFFECSVLPVFMLIYGWGYQPERVFSSLYFFFYTLISSLPLLILILFYEHSLGYFYFGFNIIFSNHYLFMFFIFSFLVKLPIFFFHLWLPKAHVEAPSMGSMILAGVMLKLGGYGLIRVLGLFIDLVLLHSYIFISVSLIGCLYIGFFCLLQSDLKVLVAYSSVSHMGLVICGIFSLTNYGFVGSLFLMMSHGLVSSGLFYLVGCLFDRLGSRSIFLMKGLLNFMPSFMMFFFIMVITNMSFPPSLNLVSEIFICFSLIVWDELSLIYIFFSFFLSACAMVNFFSYINHGYFSGLLFYLDSGYIREYYCFLLHILPLYLFIMNLNFFF
uniref:NADH-ubiquinone oxidoreductase chain 4 n=1 Tax=Sogata hakonensis TaxID=871477 RepID=A0A7S4YZ11_9HEMI|nr:NADH dehydrogenase subunit 4 [Sogata hakonensis]